jgi:hypothetical protein
MSFHLLNRAKGVGGGECDESAFEALVFDNGIKSRLF